MPYRLLLVPLLSLLFAISSIHGLSESAVAAEGAWKDRTQLVWSKATGGLIRKSFRVWDPQPELDLDFLWEPRFAIDANSSDPMATGAGTLTWYAKGAASYDRRFTYSVFKGNLKDGRPDGRGNLAMRTGRTYDGEWSNGLMHGRGTLRSEDGDKYEGTFVRGKMEGTGKYTSADGWIYVGEFRNGLRDGVGRLTLVTGTYLTTWRQGEELSREKASNDVAAQPPVPLRLAALSNAVKIKLSLDHKKAAEYVGDDPDTDSHLYDVDYSPGSMAIRLGSKKIFEAWKMGGRMPAGDEEFRYIMHYSQFPPVFLKVEIDNEGQTPQEIKSAAIEIAESSTDLTPFLQVHHAEDQGCQVDDAYGPDLEFRNLGWGRVRKARMIYSLGTRQSTTSAVTASLGSFDTSKKVSVVSRLRELGVDTARLRRASAQARNVGMGREQALRYAFACERGAVQDENANRDGGKDEVENPPYVDKEIEACVSRVKRSGVLGQLRDRVFASDTKIYTTVQGRVEYEWEGIDGQTRNGKSEFSINIPLIAFNLEMGEMGCEDPIIRESAALKLSLDRRNYRIALPTDWNARLAPGAGSYRDLQLSAEKSSQHKFRLVLKLADGSEVLSPAIDFSYFRPRLARRR